MPDFRRFLRPEAARRARRLELRARRTVEGFLTGMHRSPYFGQSVEFLQHRPYTRGDDLRHIDWKVWARQDRLHIKQYEEETNLRCTLVVDGSGSMDYGQGEAQKFEYAASAAACLAYLVLRQQDAAGLVCFGASRKTVPARSHQRHLDRILQALAEVRPRGAAGLASVLRETAEAAPRRGLVVILSDLLGTGDGLLTGMQMLRQRGHDVMVMQVLHDDEVEFPFSGATRFEGLESDETLNCNPRALREDYLRALNEFVERTRRACARLTVDYTMVRTSQPLGGVLAQFLDSRLGMTASRR